MGRTSKAFLLAAARMANILLGLALAATLSRLLDKPVYGAFQQVVLIYMLTSTAFVVGLPQSVFYFLPRYQGTDRKTFAFGTLLLLAGQGGLISLGLYFGADIIGRFLNSPLLPAMLRACALHPVHAAVHGLRRHHDDLQPRGVLGCLLRRVPGAGVCRRGDTRLDGAAYCRASIYGF